MSDNSDKNIQKPDLSALTDFQFGPNWARSKDAAPRKEYSSPREDFAKRPGNGKFRPRDENSSFTRDRRNDRERSFDKPRGDREFRGDRKFDRFNRQDRNDRPERQERQPVEPTPGVRAEIRPVDAGLGSIANEIHKHKRCYSLYDLAKLFMGGRERYEIWYIREENGPELLSCTKAPAVWLTKEEALASLWQSPWFSDFYEEVVEEVEAPKGQFNAIARCGMSDTLIGPVNWHGYQAALARLHAERFAHMSFDRFKSRVVVDRSEEAVAQWLESATKRSVWKTKREDAKTLQNRREVEEDFQASHFGEVFEVTGKCHVIGTIASRSLSHGLFAHLLKLVETARRHPAQIIPNICHGLARHHLPIFKWNNGHHTGPSRPHSLPSDTKLAERPSAIIEWIEKNAGGKIDAMLAELAALPDTTPAPEAPVTAVTAPQSELNTETEEAAPADVTTPVELQDQVQSEIPTTAETTEETPVTGEETVPAVMPDAAETAEKQPAAVKYTPSVRDLWLADLMWLQQQGFILVTPEGRIYSPKACAEQPKARDKKGKKGKPANKAGSVKKEKKAPADSVKTQKEKPEAPASAKEESSTPETLEPKAESTEAATEIPVSPSEESANAPEAAVDAPVEEVKKEEAEKAAEPAAEKSAE